MTAPAALELRGVGKRFGEAWAVRGVTLALARGEVHALAGENGAGKSTIVKMIAGAQPPDEGEIRVAGATRRLVSPRAARASGVAVVHQELALVGSMSVAENLALGRGGGLFSRRDDARREAARRLAAIGLEVDPDAEVGALSLATRQLVEIARGVGDDASVFLLDEPTSALSEADAERLFERVDALRAQGRAVLFVSHRARDLARVADRITVLRDGRVALAERYADVSRDELATALLGRALEAPPRVDEAPAGPPALSLRDVRVDDGARLVHASFDVRRGEIVGLAGLRGAGASELVSALGGATPGLRGDVVVEGGGVALVAADRRRWGVVPDMPARENATLSALGRLAPRGLLDRRREAAAIDALRRAIGLEGVDLDAPMASLSGGTQQKVCVLRAALARPRVLLLDEPTRGVDVGAKVAIHRFLVELARGGGAVLFASTDVDELAILADRVLVFASGRVAAELPRGRATPQAILAASMEAP